MAERYAQSVLFRMFHKESKLLFQLGIPGLQFQLFSQALQAHGNPVISVIKDICTHITNPRVKRNPGTHLANRDLSIVSVFLKLKSCGNATADNYRNVKENLSP